VPTTYKVIASTTVGSSGAATIEFASIPATYTDLVLKLSARTDEAGQGRSYVRLRFNSDASSVYSYTWVFAYDNNVANGVKDANISTGLVAIVPAPNSTANTFGNTEYYIPNYAGSKHKILSINGVSDNNSSSTFHVGESATLWASTSAITTITLHAVNVGSGNKFVEHSTATLYGIKNS
jgi:hypothetical protein